MSDLDPGRSQTAVKSALRVLGLIALPLLSVLVLPIMRFHGHNFHVGNLLAESKRPEKRRACAYFRS
jgi:hypothetical protein